MFKKEHHLQIATILQSLDSDLLLKHSCLFGGGTSIVLSHAEYRESVDIDFLISDRLGYQALRQMLTEKGIQSIARPGQILTASRDIRADQYGIRTMLRVTNTDIKFEIIFEGRISLEEGSAEDKICGVSTLTPLDMAATKLLANSDRWNDRSVFSRDIIDLAMLHPSRVLFNKAVEKAKGAYGESIEKDLIKAIEALKAHPERLQECMYALKIDDVPQAVLWKNIRNLMPKK